MYHRVLDLLVDKLRWDRRTHSSGHAMHLAKAEMYHHSGPSAANRLLDPFPEEAFSHATSSFDSRYPLWLIALAR